MLQDAPNGSDIFFKSCALGTFDTNIVIYVIKRRPMEVAETFNRHVGQMCISSITFAELIHGAEKSSRPEHNLLQVKDFSSRLELRLENRIEGGTT